MSWLQFLGRFHPVILHLPIGILIGAFGLEWINRRRPKSGLDSAIQPLLFWGMVTAVITALLGFFLHWEGGYEARMLNLHKYLGIGTAALSCVIYFQKKTGFLKPWYFPMFGLTIITLLLAGHFGGSLTHGSAYLTDRIPPGMRNMLGMPEATDLTQEAVEIDSETLVFQDLIQPIFRRKCTSCHNPEKAKGELLLHNQEGVEKGGKDGPLFVAGDPESSLLIKRIHLPLDNEDHMPPDGKTQLTDDELTLIEWWISVHQGFTDRVADVKITDPVQAIFDKSRKIENPVFAMDLKDPGEKRLVSLRDQGVKVMRLAAENPLLEINMSYRSDLPDNFLRQLDPVADQIAYLNLGKTNVGDEMLSNLSRFKHLVRLYLDRSAITDVGLQYVNGLPYLEYLNLYGSAITDDGLSQLDNLPELKEIYLWQTKVTDEGIKELTTRYPQLMVSTGLSATEIGSVIALQPPVIQVDETLFTDSVLVRLILNMDEVNMYYTLDGTDPDSTSLRYSGPFYVKRTAEVKAFAAKEGWKPSPVDSKQLIRSKYRPKQVTLDKSPNQKYQAQGPGTLIDFNKGTNQFGDGKWLGFEKQDVTVTLDMGASIPISTVTVGCLENASSWIYFPRGIQVMVSVDGKQFKPAGKASFPEATQANAPATKNFTVTFPQQQARYIRVVAIGQKTNPRWHPNPGEPCWLFMDVILVD